MNTEETLEMYREQVSNLAREVDRLKATHTRGDIATRMAKVFAGIARNPAPQGVNSHFNYKYLSIAQVTDLVRPLLGEHGIAMIPTVEKSTQTGKKTLVHLRVMFIAAESGEYIETLWIGEAMDNQDKGHNKAYTAALKQCLMKTFQIADGDEDPDGDAPKPNKTKPKAKKPNKGQEKGNASASDTEEAKHRRWIFKLLKETELADDEMDAARKAWWLKIYKTDSLKELGPAAREEVIQKLDGLSPTSPGEGELSPRADFLHGWLDGGSEDGS